LSYFHKITFAFLPVFALCFSVRLQAQQLYVSNTAPDTISPVWLIKNILLGTGVNATNISFTGDSTVQIGYFEGTNSNIGLASGIIMTSGDITNAQGPNNAAGATGTTTIDANDQDLADLIGTTLANVHDAAVLEFDFIPVGDSIKFRYVFASEEYNDFVCSNFNDVFGFFLSGPGITGPFQNNAVNIALIPGTNTPVSINNVNEGSATIQGNPPQPCTVGTNNCPCNAAYFVNNEFPVLGTSVQYDGFTVVLTATLSGLQCAQTYHIKLAIADVFDQSFDSGVFLEQGSFTSPGIQVEINTVTGEDEMLEGCANADFIFIRPDTSGIDTVIFFIGGNAINGVDYSFLSDTVFFPSGEDSIIITISPIVDGVNEPIPDTVIVTVANITVCGDTIYETATLLIIDGYGLPMTSSNVTTVCSGNSINISTVASGGTTPYSYNWSNGDTGPSTVVAPLVTDTFFVTATDFPGCPGIDTIVVTVQNLLPIVDAGNDTSFCAGDSVQINATGGITYVWSPTLGLSNPNIANPIASNPGTTEYFVTVTDGNTCQNTDSVTVIQNVLPFADAGNDTSICTGNSVVIGGAPTGPDSTSFSWSPSASLNNATNPNPTATPTATPTTYIITVTDTNSSCVNTDTVVVSLFSLPIANAGTDDTICAGDSVQLSGLGGGNYNWLPVTGLNNPNIQNPNASPIITTAYELTVTDGNGCTDKDSVTLTVNNLPIIDAGNDTTICIGSSITIGGSPTGPSGSIFGWSPADSLNNTTIANPIANPSVTTTYTIVVTDTNGCTNTDSITITVNNLPFVDAGNDTSICGGQSVTIGGNPTGPGGSAFNWSPAATLNNPSIANPIATPIVSPATYTVVVTDVNGCSDSDSVTVTLFPLPSVNAGTDDTICLSDSVQLNGSGTGSFSWAPTTGLSNPNIASPMAGPSVTTIYTLTVIDGNNCTNTDDATVVVNSLPTADAGPDTTAICFGLSVPIGGSPTTNAIGAAINWLPIDSLSSATDPNPTANPSITTLYTVTVTDTNGCVNSDSILLIINPLPVIDAGPDDTICTGNSTVIGGSPTCNSCTAFGWTPFGSLNNFLLANPTASPTLTTTYLVIGTNANLCVNSDAVTVVVNPLPTVNAGNDTAMCIGDSTQLNATGGINYSWSPTDSLTNPSIANPIAFPSSTTTYTVTVTDTNTCSNTDDLIITVNSLPLADAGPDLWVCPGDSIEIVASGGIIYSWSPSTGLSDTAIANPMSSPPDTMIYSVTITDANGCVNSDSMKIDVGPIVPTDAGNDTAICIGDTIQIGGNPTSPPNSTYSWTPLTDIINPDSANPFVFPSNTITYTVITNNFTCTGEDSIQIVVNPLPIVDAGSNVQICIGDTTQLIATGGSAYAWSPTDSLSNPINDSTFAFPSDTTTYTVTITDPNSCVNFDSVTVIVNPLPTIVTSGNASICIGDTAQLIASGGSAYVWSPTDSLSNPINDSTFAFPSNTTTYTVSVTDSNSCVDSDLLTVTVSPLPAITTSGNVQICIGDSTLLTATGGNTYNWLPTDSLSNPNNDTTLAFPSDTTTYAVTVTDSNSCVSSDSLIVTVNPLPVIDAGLDDTICFGDTSQLNATGAVAYTWSPTAGLSNPSIATPLAIPSATTAYIVSGTDSNSCVNSDTVLIIVNPLPVVNASVNPAQICLGDSAQLSASGGAIYIWSPPDSLTDANIANPIAFPSSTTDYAITITDSNSCVNSDTVLLSVNALPNVDAGADVTICFGDSTQLNASGGISYSWSPADSLTNPNIANPIAFPADTTAYIVTITDSNSCINSDTIIVFVQPLPPIDAGNDTAICIGDCANLLATGGNSYLWSPATGLSDPNIPNPLACPDSNTTYFVLGSTNKNLITNGNFESGNAGITTDLNLFNPPAPPNISVEEYSIVTDASQASSNWIGTDHTSGNGNFFVAFYNVDTLNAWCQTVSVNPNTNYTFSAWFTSLEVPMTSALLQITINGNTVLTFMTPFTSGTWQETIGIWNSQSNTTATICIQGIWGFEGATWFGMDDVYFVEQIGGCSNVDSVTVTVNSLPIADAGNDTSICAGESVQLNATGGQTYSWSPSAGLSNPNISNPLASPADSTKYYVTVTNSNACSNVDSVVITIFSILVIPDISTCEGDSILLSVTTSNGYSPFVYQWSPPTGLSNTAVQNPNASPSSNTIYTVKVIDFTGCADSASISVSVLGNPTANFTFVLQPSCEGIFAAFENQSENADFYNWLFSDGDTSSAENPSHVFEYEQVMNVILTALNSSGCNDEISISEPIEKFIDYFNLTIPNVFTPNNDGQNDWFEIDFNNKLQECTDLNIYNRWGQLVFTSSGNTHSWNGRTFDGEEAQNGTYYFVFEINTLPPFRGAITLMR